VGKNINYRKRRFKRRRILSQEKNLFKNLNCEIASPFYKVYIYSPLESVQNGIFMGFFLYESIYMDKLPALDEDLAAIDEADEDFPNVDLAVRSVETLEDTEMSAAEKQEEACPFIIRKKKKETEMSPPVNDEGEVLAEPKPKKPRSEKQLAHMKKLQEMRVMRKEKAERLAKEKEIKLQKLKEDREAKKLYKQRTKKAPAEVQYEDPEEKWTPTPKKPPPTPQDEFFEFMNNMDKYKKLKAHFKKEEQVAQTQAKTAPAPAPAPSPQKKTHTNTIIGPPKPHNAFNDYFG